MTKISSGAIHPNYFLSPRSLSKIQLWKEQASLCANSLVGKTIRSIAAEAIGGYLGSSVFGRIERGPGKSLGKLAGGSFSLIIGGICACSALKASRAQKAVFLTGCVAAVLCTAELARWGSSIGSVAGDWIGQMSGGIVGGYIGLKCVGDNPAWYDESNPLNSYSISMLRFLSAGIGYDLLLGCKNSVPYIGMILGLPRMCLRGLIQTAAYNYLDAKDFIEESIRKRQFNKQTFIPFLAEMIRNVARGTHSNGSTKQIAKSISDAVPLIGSLLEAQREKLFKIGIEKGMQTIETNADVLAASAFRSLHDYVELIRHSDPIQNILKNCRNENFFEELPKVLRKEIEKQLPLKGKLLNTIWPSLLNDTSIEEGLTNKIVEVRELEQKLFGFSVIGREKGLRLNKLAAIYLRYYIAFALLKGGEPSKGVPLDEEQQISLDISAFLFDSVLKPALPPVFTNTVQRAVDLSINVFFKIRKIVSKCFQRPEQITTRRFDIEPESNYFPLPSPKKEESFVEVIEPRTDWPDEE